MSLCDRRATKKTAKKTLICSSYLLYVPKALAFAINYCVHWSYQRTNISANQDTMIITHNGEAKVVVQDIRVFEETQESMAMLKMLAQSSANIKKKMEKTSPL